MKAVLIPKKLWEYHGTWNDSIGETIYTWEESSKVGSEAGSAVQLPAISAGSISSVMLNITQTGTLGEGGEGTRTYLIGYSTKLEKPDLVEVMAVD